jgi:MoxR-like ATPase
MTSTHSKKKNLSDDTVASIYQLSKRIIANLEKVIVGKQQALEFTVASLLCQGHLLIEDVPGVGKTMLARSLALSLGCSINRIQFTPDMLPSDVIGVSIFNQNNRKFEFRAGPLFSNIILADEINRATPKTQSALLEAMEEKQVTVDGITHTLDKPFMVMATQNPIEYEGTFPLPEAQLDRFLFRISLGYPAFLDEIKVLENQQHIHPIFTLKNVISKTEILEAQENVKMIYISPAVKRYIVELTRATRHHKDVYLGASPRGSIGLFKAGQTIAAINQRDFVLPDDIKLLAEAVLAHRLVINPSALVHNTSAPMVVREILETVPVPTNSNFES